MPGKGSNVKSNRSRSVPKERTSSSAIRGSPAKPQRMEKAAPPASGSPFSSTSLAEHTDGDLNIKSLNLGAVSRPSSSGSSCASSYRGEEKCRCQICNCGKHQCPKAPAYSPSPFEGSTSYGNTFKGHDSQHFPERARAPQSLYSGVKAHPSHFSTTHNSTYIEHENDHYNKFHEHRMEKAARPPRPKPTDKFDHTSSHQNDFPWHNVDPPARSPSPSHSYTRFGSGPSDFNTTYGNHFVSSNQRPASPARRPVAEYSYGSPRDFSTTHQLQYHGQQNGRPASPAVKPSTAYNYGSPRDFSTTHKSFHDGQQHPICPASVLPNKPVSARTGHMKFRVDMSTGTWG